MHNSIQCDVADFLYYAAYIIITTTIISLYFRVVLFLHPLILILSLNILILSLNILILSLNIRFDGEHDAMGVGNRLVLRTLPASNGPKCTCTVVAVYPVTSAYHACDSTCHAHSLAVYPVTSAYHARDSTCHAHSLAFVKFEVPFLPIDPGHHFTRETWSGPVSTLSFVL